MKKYIAEFCKRGLMAAGGGPVVLAIVYGILGQCDVINSLSPAEVTKGILTVTLMAFIAAGITVVYTIDRLPLLFAGLLHGGALYADYLLMYIANNWIPRNPGAIVLFTGIFIAGYAVIWLCIYAVTKSKTDKINAKLKKA